MASNFYHYILPDYGDLDNDTGNHPGFVFGVRENDGGVGLYMYPADTPGDNEQEYTVFLNVKEAKKLMDSLNQTIDRADSKLDGNERHKDRAKEPG